jgi:hypothetical protein
MLSFKRSPAGFSSQSRGELRRTAVAHGLFIVAPALVILLTLTKAISIHAFALDFDHGPWVAGGRLLAGMSLYVGPHSPDVVSGAAFVYPAVAAVMSVPFALLPRVGADVLYTALCAATVFLTLRLCGVRDWRVYGITFLWPPVVSGLQTANVTLLVGLGMAGAWRYRDRALTTGFLIALLISVKLFLWPLALWLLVTRRYAALAWTILWGVALNLVAWTILGFDQIGRYLRLISAVTNLAERHGYTLIALAYGAGRTTAYLLAVALAGCVVTAAVVLGRRGRDLPAFGLCIAACLLVSPLVWLHYFALLMVPLALARPKLAPVWFAPVLLSFPISAPHSWQIIVALIVAGSVTSAALPRRQTRGHPRIHAAKSTAMLNASS